MGHSSNSINLVVPNARSAPLRFIGVLAAGLLAAGCGDPLDIVLESITVTPNAVTLAAGFSAQLTATASYSDLTTQDVTADTVFVSADLSYVWTFAKSCQLQVLLDALTIPAV